MKRERGWEEERWKWRGGKHIVAMGRPLSHHYQNGKRLCKRHAARGTELRGRGRGKPTTWRQTETKQICGPVWHRLLPACLPTDVFFVSFTFSHNCQLTAPELSPRHRRRRRITKDNKQKTVKQKKPCQLCWRFTILFWLNFSREKLFYGQGILVTI